MYKAQQKIMYFNVFLKSGLSKSECHQSRTHSVSMFRKLKIGQIISKAREAKSKCLVSVDRIEHIFIGP